MKKSLILLLIAASFIVSCKKNNATPNQISQNSIIKKWYLFETKYTIYQEINNTLYTSPEYDNVNIDTSKYIRFYNDGTCVGTNSPVYGINYSYSIKGNNLFLSQNNVTLIDTIILISPTKLTIKNTERDTINANQIIKTYQRQELIYYFVSDKSLL